MEIPFYVIMSAASDTEIAPRLVDIPIAALRHATGLSRAYVKRIKRGHIPHSRHWGVLRGIVTEQHDETP